MIPLYYFTWNVTYRCNLKCPTCYNDKDHDGAKELDTDEGFGLIDSAIGLGAVSVLFTGGEPLIRDDIFELMNYAKSKGLFVCLATNGILIKEEMIPEICKCVDRINFGYSGLEIDRSKTSETIRDIRDKKEKINISINYTAYSEESCSNIRELSDICDELKSEMSVKRYIPVGYGQKNKEDFAVCDYVKVSSVIEELQRNGKKISFRSDPIFGKESRDKAVFGGCLAGIHSLSIDPYGSYLVCTKLPHVLGNLREEKLEQFWEKSEYLAKLRRRELDGKCGACEFKISCGGCRAAAYRVDGNIFGADPICNKLE